MKSATLRVSKVASWARQMQVVFKSWVPTCWRGESEALHAETLRHLPADGFPAFTGHFAFAIWKKVFAEEVNHIAAHDGLPGNGGCKIQPIYGFAGINRTCARTMRSPIDFSLSR